MSVGTHNTILAVLAASPIAFFAQTSEGATVIRGFEEYANGTVWAQQYPEFNITTDTAGAVLMFADLGPYAVEGSRGFLSAVPNQGAVGNSNFTAIGSNRFLGFSVNGIEDVGESVADVFIYNSASALIANFSIIGPATGTTPQTFDLSVYSDVARFEIRNITDIGGFAIDRIVVDTAGVPAPGAIALLGLAGLAGRRRR